MTLEEEVEDKEYFAQRRQETYTVLRIAQRQGAVRRLYKRAARPL